jgi:hypothetical protein
MVQTYQVTADEFMLVIFFTAAIALIVAVSQVVRLKPVMWPTGAVLVGTWWLLLFTFWRLG